MRSVAVSQIILLKSERENLLKRLDAAHLVRRAAHAPAAYAQPLVSLSGSGSTRHKLAKQGYRATGTPRRGRRVVPETGACRAPRRPRMQVQLISLA